MKDTDDANKSDPAVERTFYFATPIAAERLAPHADRSGGVLPFTALFHDLSGGVEPNVSNATINADYVKVKDGEIAIEYCYDKMAPHSDDSQEPAAPGMAKWLGTYFVAPGDLGVTKMFVYVDGEAKGEMGFAGDEDFKTRFGQGSFRWFQATAEGYSYKVCILWQDDAGKVHAVEQATVVYRNVPNKFVGGPPPFGDDVFD